MNYRKPTKKFWVKWHGYSWQHCVFATLLCWVITMKGLVAMFFFVVDLFLLNLPFLKRWRLSSSTVGLPIMWKHHKPPIRVRGCDNITLQPSTERGHLSTSVHCLWCGRESVSQAKKDWNWPRGRHWTQLQDRRGTQKKMNKGNEDDQMKVTQGWR